MDERNILVKSITTDRNESVAKSSWKNRRGGALFECVAYSQRLIYIPR